VTPGPIGLLLASDNRPSAPWPLGDVTQEVVPVANVPVVERQLVAFREAGIREVLVVAGPVAGDAIRQLVGHGSALGLDVDHVAVSAPLGLAEGLLVAEPWLAGRPFVVQLGATILGDALDALVEGVSRGSADLIAMGEAVPISRRRGLMRVEEHRGGAVVTPTYTSLVRGDAFAFSPSIFGAIRQLVDAGATEIEVGDLVRHIAKTGTVKNLAIAGWARHVRDPDDLLEVNRMLLDEAVASYGGAMLERTNIQGAVVIHETAQIDSATIRGPAVIGPRAYVGDAYIGPYTSIGEDTAIESVEIENSIVLGGAVLGQLGARLEGSVIGRGAKVTRSFGLPHAVRLWVGSDAEVSLQ